MEMHSSGKPSVITENVYWLRKMRLKSVPLPLPQIVNKKSSIDHARCASAAGVALLFVLVDAVIPASSHSNDILNRKTWNMR